MAITNKINEFVILGIKDLLVFTRDSGELVGDIKYLVDISISDEIQQSDLRGGFGNPKLLTIYGDRTTSMSANSASMSVDLLRIMTGQGIVAKSKLVDVEPEVVTITNTSATLKEAPATSSPLTVYLTDGFGRNIQKLTKVSASPTTGQYSINGTTITVASGLTGKLRVYYQVSKEVEIIEAKGGTPPTFRMTAKAVAKDLETGLMYACDIEIPKATVSSSYSIGGKNSSETPDNVPVTVDMLHDSEKGYPYAITFMETVA